MARHKSRLYDLDCGPEWDDAKGAVIALAIVAAVVLFCWYIG